jgi:hypothetical protein
MFSISRPHKLYHYTPAMPGKYGLMNVLDTANSFSNIQPQIIFTTALIEAHGVFTVHYQLLRWSHALYTFSSVDLALQWLFHHPATVEYTHYIKQ